jgi:lipopolysaccharide/colanic/teichoic acid biosynthesis glycosyltransferase
MRNRQVTRVGAWLRRTGIDELLQFINVCRGEMSVVGPRALTAADVERLGWNAASHDWRFAATPGITGLPNYWPAEAHVQASAWISSICGGNAYFWI